MDGILPCNGVNCTCRGRGRLSRQRETQNSVGQWHQGRRGGADLLDDFRVRSVESPRQRAESGQDQLGGGGDEAAARYVPPTDVDAILWVKVPRHLRARIAPVSFVAEDDA